MISSDRIVHFIRSDPVTSISRYIEEYPEDAEKWLEFFSKQDVESLRAPIVTNGDIQLLSNLNDTVIVDSTNNTYNEDICNYCKRSWESTSQYPTMTLLCGHKSHTECLAIAAYSRMNYFKCIIDGCTIDTIDTIDKIVRSRNTEDAENIIVNNLTTALKGNSDFNKDINELKKLISKVSVEDRSYKSFIMNERARWLKRNEYSINALKKDLNDSYKTATNSDKRASVRLATRLYRKKAAYIFNKYHLTLRELINQKLVNVSWRIRWPLERHVIRKYPWKFALRLRPGTSDTIRVPIIREEPDDV